MSESTITTAASEYARRPKDERFESPQAMLAAAEFDRAHSREVTYNTRDLQVIPASADGRTGAYASNSEITTLQLQSPKGRAAGSLATIDF